MDKHIRRAIRQKRAQRGKPQRPEVIEDPLEKILKEYKKRKRGAI